MRKTPLWQAIANSLREDIAEARYQPGDKLPTEAEHSLVLNLCLELMIADLGCFLRATCSTLAVHTSWHSSTHAMWRLQGSIYGPALLVCAFWVWI